MNNKLKEQLIKEEQAAFAGWDFSRLDGRWEEEVLPWDYRNLVLKHLKNDDKLLDMGTGGGEFLLSLNHPCKNTCVTEGYEPNYLLCKEKLEPLGIGVFKVTDDKSLPFDDASFDIIINRHESFSYSEVYRILKAGGIFITQQVGGKNNVILSKRLIDNYKQAYETWNLETLVGEIREKSFNVTYENEYYPYIKFFDIGAIVYFAKVIEWEFPDFSVEKCFDKLIKMDEEIKEKNFIESKEHRFIVVCRK